MEKFIQKNYVWLGIVAVLLVALLVKGNGSANPKTTENLSNSLVATPIAQTQNSDDLQFKCAQLGATAKSTFETKYPDVSQTLLTDVVFHYNTRLHKCYFGREVHNKDQDGSGSVWKGITDLYSNKDVLYNIDFLSPNGNITGEFSAINYIGYPNEQGGGVIKSRIEFESLYNKILTE